MAYLIVDGYNIINNWPELEELREESLEAARVKLAELLHEFTPLLWEKIIIVYDAYRIKGKLNSYESLKGVETVYTSEGKTADTIIERMVVDLNKQGKDVEVASSDNLEQHIIIWKGGRRLSARELRNLIKESRQNIINNNFDTPSKNVIDRMLSQEVKSRLEKLRRI